VPLCALTEGILCTGKLCGCAQFFFEFVSTHFASEALNGYTRRRRRVVDINLKDLIAMKKQLVAATLVALFSAGAFAQASAPAPAPAVAPAATAADAAPASATHKKHHHKKHHKHAASATAIPSSAAKP
jgi:hypothetical protein